MPGPQNGQTDFASGVDVGVEPRAASIGGFGVYLGRFARVFGAEVDGEFEEAVLVGGAVRTDDEGSDMADVFFLASDGDG